MLGKVARWLVLMGYDAAYAARGLTDAQLVEQAQKEGRIFLTKDMKIPDVAGVKKIIVRESAFESQLRRVFQEARLKWDPSRFFTRCTYCNKPLEPVAREEALPLVPPKVHTLETTFSRCPDCKKMYWQGTHTQRTVDSLKDALRLK
jgi:uncharacterized protein